LRLEISPRARRRRCCAPRSLDLGVFIANKLLESDVRDLDRWRLAFSLLEWRRGVRVARAGASLRNIIMSSSFEESE
jgi:hypothetical protein